jgi:hypothetical protein
MCDLLKEKESGNNMNRNHCTILVISKTEKVLLTLIGLEIQTSHTMGKYSTSVTK